MVPVKVTNRFNCFSSKYLIKSWENTLIGALGKEYETVLSTDKAVSLDDIYQELTMTLDAFIKSQ